MRIEYLLLENFALVKSGMGLDKIELDFSDCKNMITLIIGNNGTGKTGAILANIHPYAGLGHLESRNDTDIIIPGKRGHKLAIFKTEKHIYKIEHHYIWQGPNKSRKISSYCLKDNKELNPSGLVSKFNEIIEREFNIDINFLKLMRLGPNVKNFIGLSATERKGFISKLLENVDIYLQDQKTITEKSNLLRSALKVAMDKSNQLNIKDITLIEDSINQKSKLLEYHKKEKEETIKKFFTYKGSIDLSSIESYDESLLKYNHDLQELRNQISSLKKPMYTYLTINDKNPLSDFNDKLLQYDTVKSELVYEMATINTKIEKLNEDKFGLEKKLNEANSVSEMNELETYLNELKEKIFEYENTHKNPVTELTKGDLISDVDKLNMILFHLDQILTLPIYVLDYFKLIYHKYKNDINSMENYATDRERTVSVLLQQASTKISNEITTVLFTPSGCAEWKKCPYYDYWNQHDKKGHNKKETEYKQELDCLQGIHIIASSIYSIRRILSMRKNIKEYDISEKNVIETILHGDKSYFMDGKVIQTLLETIEERDEYNNNIKRRKEIENELQLKQALGNISITDVISGISNINAKISELQAKLFKITSDIDIVNGKISKIQDSINDYGVFIEYENKRMIIKHQMDNLYKVKENLDKVAGLADEFKKKEVIYNGKIERLTNLIQATEQEIYDLKTKISLYKNLQKEIKKIEENFDYNELIRDAVSSKSGIPKIHIVHYCKALKSIANSIISEIYGGELILRDFEITDSKFNIPYYTKGANVDDIIHASQAETSIVTLAISFAILMQFMPKYSIILLDEIDGPLSPQYKTKMLATLEGQLKALGSEQCFLITQSDQYLDYPVNLIITDKEHRNMIRSNHKVIFSR